MVYFLKDVKQGLHFWNLRNKARIGAEKGKNLPMTEPVDFVVTWVDGSDPQWREARQIHAQKNGIPVNDSNNGEERYRDWDIFRYWFRAVECYAPWVRHVYLITCGHVPQWLDVNAQKLKLVSHADYIPPENLPTFNSNVIELNMHRIEGLAEHFVYFNDDMFLMRPCVPEDFFRGGLPNHCAVAQPLDNPDNSGFYHHLFSTLGAINRVFCGHVGQAVSEYPEKWFFPGYGSEMIWNKYAAQMDVLPGMFFSHLPTPMRKSSFERVWNAFPELLAETSSHPFRKSEDVMHQIVSLWEIMSGTFQPVSMMHFGKVFSNPVRNIDDVLDALGREKYCSICINDSQYVAYDDFLKIKKMIAERMEAVFPVKSSFEK